MSSRKKKIHKMEGGGNVSKIIQEKSVELKVVHLYIKRLAPTKIDENRLMPRYISVKFQNTGNKEKIVQISRGLKIKSEWLKNFQHHQYKTESNGMML